MNSSLKEIVINILEKDEKARGNDMHLYVLVLTRLGLPTNLKELALTTSVNYFETISRIRRKVQQTNPRLLPNNHINKRRKQREEYFKELAKGV